jgi:hypothetical protein
VLVGPSGGGAWQITGSDSGTLSYGDGAQLDFSNIENLRGADEADDAFVFSRRGKLSGVIDGGEGGNDSLEIRGEQVVDSVGVEDTGEEPQATTVADGLLDLSGVLSGSSIIITVTAPGAVSVSGSPDSDGDYIGVTSIIGSAGSDVLVGPAEDSTWDIDGPDAGRLVFAAGAVAMRFSAIESLRGADQGDDEFLLWATGNLSGGLEGGSGGWDSFGAEDGAPTITTSGIEEVSVDPVVPPDPAADDGTLDLSAEDSDLTITVTGAGTVSVSGSLASDGDYTGVTSVIGGSGSDTLVGPADDATWDVTLANGGELSFAAGAARLAFAGFEWLQGADDHVDAFFIDELGSVNGGIGGGQGGGDSLVSETGEYVETSGLESITGMLGLDEDATWNVTGDGTGSFAVDSNWVGFDFAGFESLSGTAANQDTFFFQEGGRLSGVLEGGAAGFDTLVLNGGSYHTVVYTATGPTSGSIDRDGDVITYSGLEPIMNTGTADDAIFKTSDFDDRAELTDSGAMLTLGPGSIPSFESVTFTKPMNSLTINLGEDLDVPILSKDVLTITDVDLGSANLTINGEDGKDEVKFVGTNTAGDVQVNAEKIDLSSSTLNASNVTLTAAELEDDADITEGVFLALPSAEIDLTGATLNVAGGAVQMTATATAQIESSTFTLGPVGGALFAVHPTANITMSDTTVTAASLSAESKVVVDISAEDMADSMDGDTDEQSDAAIAVVVVVSDATTSVTGSTSITTTGAVSLKATTDVDIVSNADGGSDTSAKGGTVAVTDLHATTQAFVSDTAAINAGADIDVLAEFDGDIATTAKSTAGGAQASAMGDNESEQRLGDANQDGMGGDSAQTAEGSLTFAGAVGVLIYVPTTQAYIDSSGAVTTTGGSLDVGASATDKVALTADGTNTGSSGTGVGVGAALNYTNATTKSHLDGSGARTATGGIKVSSTLASGNSYSVEAKSGVGDSSSVSFAGALAINIALTSVESVIKSGTTSNFGSSDLTVEASSTTKTSTKATADADADDEATGVGPSVAFVYANNDTRAAIETDATVDTTGDITVSATGKQTTDTKADGGAAGGETGVTPVVAASVPLNDTVAEIQSGAALMSGDVTVKAKQTTQSSTLAKGAAEGSDLAFGLSFGLTIAEDEVIGRLERDVTSTGAVTVSAESASATSTDAKASSKGTESSGGGGNADAQTQSQVDHTNTQVSNNNEGTGTGTSSAPSSDTSSGAVSFAGAIGVNVPKATATAVIAGTDTTAIAVSAAGAVSAKSSANTDAEAIGDGKAKTTSDGTAIGAGVAVNAPGTTNTASIADANVTADGVTVEAGMTERKLDIDAVTTVDTDADTIFVGDAAGLSTGEQVTYSAGGGGAIGGLTDGDTDLYVIKVSGKRIKLADTLADAQAGTAINLTDLGSGDSHKIDRADPKEDIEFDPDKLRLEISNDAGLNTGDAVVYDNGGGTDIDDLDDDTTYFAIVDGSKQLRLAETRDKAYKGESIDITSAGTGEDHSITEKTHSAEAHAISGASGGDTGAAGSVAINLGSATTTASLQDGATLTLQDGAVDGDGDTGALTITASAVSHNQARALPHEEAASGKSLGFGLSFAFNLSEFDTLASIDGGAEVTTSGDVTVKATGDHAMFTHAKAGATATTGTALNGAIAIAVASNTTTASVLGDTTALQIGGNLVIEAVGSQDQRTQGDADTKGGETGVGVGFAMGWVQDQTSAALGRDISTGADNADDVTVSATATVEATTVATGSSEGSKSQSTGGNTADQETQSQTNYANTRSGSSVGSPNAGSQVSNANTQAGNQTTNPGGQNNGNAQQGSTQTEGGTVRVAAAIGATVLLSTAEATILDGIEIQADGETTVMALMDADANTQAIGLANTKDKNATVVGAAVAINVAQLGAMALVGNATIASGSLKVQAGTPDDKKNELKALALAGGGSTQRGEGDNTAVAGAAAVNVYLTDDAHRTEASIADGAAVTTSSGDVELLARQDVGVQTIAGGGALTLSDDGTSVGAAIGVNFVNTTTLASIGAGATVNASGNVSAVADASITPLEIVTPEIEGLDPVETGIDVTTLILGAAIGSGGDAGAGSAAVDIFTTTTQAWIGAGADITAADVSVRAVNDTTVDSFVGALAGSKDATGVGIGLDVLVVTKTTEAWIAASDDAATPTMIDAGGNVTVEADSSEDLWSLTVNAGVGDSTSAPVA